MNIEIASDSDYLHWLGNIKQQIRVSQQKAALAVNHELLGLYWFIGESLSLKITEWGDKFIAHLARDLKVEFPDMKGFSVSNLKYMRRWYSYYAEHSQIGQQLVDQLKIDASFTNNLQWMNPGQQLVDLNLKILLFNIPWGHHTLILTKTNGPEEAIFYITKTIQNGWSRAILKHQMESELFKRQGKALTNFNLTLPDSRADLAQEVIKNPYNFDFLTLEEDIKEKELERALIQHMKKFLLELGRGFAYVGNQYNLNVEGDDFFLDLLFFNINLNCYVIFELKVGDFKPEFAGKLNMYVNTVNEQVKRDAHNETIGVLLCKTPNKTVVEYSIKGIKNPLGVADYLLQKAIPNELRAGLPTVEELEEELDTQIEIKLSPLEEKRNRLLAFIQSNTKEEVKIPKSAGAINDVVESVFIPLAKRIQTKIEEQQIDSWFLKSSKTYSSGSYGKNDITEFRLLLTEEKNVQEVEYRNYLDGFKTGGINAFGSSLRFSINFAEFKYTIKLNYSENPKEYLYSHTLSDTDLDRLVEEVVNQLLDSIENEVDRISNSK
jgi:predicted nuclease of restriction endonuclease-like (RecB) superfamily